MMDYHSSKNQKILAELVRREVIYCISELIGELSTDTKYDDILMDLSMVPDYEAIVENNDELDVYWDDACAGYAFKDKDGDESECYDTWIEAVEAACDDHRIDIDEYREVFEYWLVSRFLANRLEEHGEPVAQDFLGLTIWGRCTTGQAIYMDHVIGEIAEEMEILEGQKYEWDV
jgi:hypothetical protein